MNKHTTAFLEVHQIAFRLGHQKDKDGKPVTEVAKVKAIDAYAQALGYSSFDALRVEAER